MPNMLTSTNFGAVSTSDLTDTPKPFESSPTACSLEKMTAVLGNPELREMIFEYLSLDDLEEWRCVNKYTYATSKPFAISHKMKDLPKNKNHILLSPLLFLHRHPPKTTRFGTRTYPMRKISDGVAISLRLDKNNLPTIQVDITKDPESTPAGQDALGMWHVHGHAHCGYYVKGTPYHKPQLVSQEALNRWGEQDIFLQGAKLSAKLHITYKYERVDADGKMQNHVLDAKTTVDGYAIGYLSALLNAFWVVRPALEDRKTRQIRPLFNKKSGLRRNVQFRNL